MTWQPRDTANQGGLGTFVRQVVPRARRAGGSKCRLSVRLAILRQPLKQIRGVPAPPISPVDSENPGLWVCLDVVSHSDQKSCMHTVHKMFFRTKVFFIHKMFLIICVYLQPEAGGYSRRANLASPAAGCHTHPGCAVDLEESGAPSRHPPLIARVRTERR